MPNLFLSHSLVGPFNFASGFVRRINSPDISRGMGISSVELLRAEENRGPDLESFDNHDPLGRNELGGRAALPIWIEFMKFALQNVEDRPPELPEGVAQARIDPETGLIARPDNSDAIIELFEVGNMPPLESEAEGENQDVSSAEDPYENY